MEGLATAPLLTANQYLGKPCEKEGHSSNSQSIRNKNNHRCLVCNREVTKRFLDKRPYGFYDGDPCKIAEHIDKSGLTRRSLRSRKCSKCCSDKKAAHIKTPRGAMLSRKRLSMPEPTRPMPQVCEICSRPNTENRDLCLDHCHETGKFRGWLCHPCNTALGRFDDNLAGITRAFEYVKNNS